MAKFAIRPDTMRMSGYIPQCIKFMSIQVSPRTELRRATGVWSLVQLKYSDVLRRDTWPVTPDPDRRAMPPSLGNPGKI